ncbi:MAG: Fic family protein [Candidatus Riflebacteria bacterium]|nr:Fic family protein [Candidatus Riflebacteria bacterium]
MAFSSDRLVAVLTLWLALQVGVALAQDPYLDIVTDGTRTLSTTVRGEQSILPGSSASATLAEANTGAAYQQVRSLVQQSAGLSLDRVMEINGTLRQGLTSNGETGGGGLRPSKGWIRDYFMPTADDVGTTRIAYPDPKALPAEAAKLDAYLKGISSGPMTRAQAIRAAADVHSFIVQNHLFADGNGRTARMVADWILMRNGLPPADHSALPKDEYLYDRRLSPDETRARFREYMERAVAAAETRVAKLPPEARSRIPTPPEPVGGRTVGSEPPGARPLNPEAPAGGPAETRPAGPVEARPGGPVEARPGGPVGEVNPGGRLAAPGELELLGVRSGVAYTRPAISAATVAGGYYAGAIAHQWATGQPVDLWQPVKDLGTVEGACGLVGGVSGFWLGEYLAATALSSAIPIPIIGKALGRPLAQAIVRSTVGAAAGYTVGSVARGGGIDWKDLAGSSVASGVGMALGSLCFPPVGTIVGGIAGQVAWDLAYGWWRRRDKTTPAVDPPAR